MKCGPVAVASGAVLLSCALFQPDPPMPPVGPDAGSVDTTYWFSAWTPHEAHTYIDFRWDDGPGWDRTGFPGEDTASASHAWTDSGTFEVRVRSGGLDDITPWSEPMVVHIFGGVPPPAPVRPQGQENATVGDTCEYSTHCGPDPEIDSVAFRFDWGDGDTSAWSPQRLPQQALTLPRLWNAPGRFVIAAQARFSDGHPSGWSEPLVVQVADSVSD